MTEKMYMYMDDSKNPAPKEYPQLPNDPEFEKWRTQKRQEMESLLKSGCFNIKKD